MNCITLLTLALLAVLISSGLAQTLDQRDYWQRAKNLLDRSQRGEPLSASEQTFLTEARERRAREQATRNAGMQGDGATVPMKWPVAAVATSQENSPVMPLDLVASDGRRSTVFWRKPLGDGPFPAIIFIHGGLDEYPEDSLRAHLTENPIITRFLTSGYAVVMATFRSYSKEIQSRGPILDCAAALHAAALLPSVNRQRLFVYGGSGGGSIALELASDEKVCRIVACEPATVIYSGMLNTDDYEARLKMMREPASYFTDEVRSRTLAKLKTMRAPVLVIHSDKHDLVKLNKPILLPLMQESGATVEYREYPGYGHGFYWGGGGDRWGKAADTQVVDAVVVDTLKFFRNADSK